MLRDDALRTPEEAFANLAGYPFEPRYIEIGGYRMHYVDEGERAAGPVLMLHGEPTWSYLYRKMIPPVAGAGHRVIAPDLIGFGKSDKPRAVETHSYAFHVEAVTRLVEALDLRGITLVCQDWGSLIGLRVAAESEARFARIVLANGGLPTGEGGTAALGPDFVRWRKAARAMREAGDMPVGGVVAQATGDPSLVAAYDAPFPDPSYKAGPLAMPLLVPMSEDDPASRANRRAWDVLSAWKKPFLTAYSDDDPITRGAEKAFQEKVPGAKGQPHTTIEGGGHFLQEARGERFAQVVVDFIAATEGG